MIASILACGASGADVVVRFRAVVGDAELICGRQYAGVGVTKSVVTPRDFRFYIHNPRLVDGSGAERAIELIQDGQWQLDDTALLDFAAACRAGGGASHRELTGTIAPGRYRALRFTLGLPEAKNHTDLTLAPPPLNLTAMFWTWNAGRKFFRLDFASAGAPRGFIVHLGSMGCAPDGASTRCDQPNTVEVEIVEFDPAKDTVLADLKALLRDTDVDQPGGCMSEPNNPACGAIFANLGLTAGRPQIFFHR